MGVPALLSLLAIGHQGWPLKQLEEEMPSQKAPQKSQQSWEEAPEAQSSMDLAVSASHCGGLAH